MGNIRNIGIITAGGDCGGLNAVVRGAALIAESKGIGSLSDEISDEVTLCWSL